MGHVAGGVILEEIVRDLKRLIVLPGDGEGGVVRALRLPEPLRALQARLPGRPSRALLSGRLGSRTAPPGPHGTACDMVPNIDFKPAAMVAADPSAWAVRSASSPISAAMPAAAPNVPTVAVACQPVS